MENKNPSGETMIQRSRRVADMVEEILPRIRSTSGSYPHLWVRIIQKYYWKFVRVSYSRQDGSLDIHFYKFENLMHVPNPETVRRRCQEIFHREKALIQEEIDAKFPLGDFTEEQRDVEYNKLVAKNKFLPTPRKLKIRDRLENAYHNEFGAKQSDLTDYDE